MNRQQIHSQSLCKANKKQARRHEIAGVRRETHHHAVDRNEREKMLELRQRQQTWYETEILGLVGYGSSAGKLPSEKRLCTDYDAHLRHDADLDTLDIIGKGEPMTQPVTQSEPATARQLWYLHCITRTDTRTWKLTKQEASTMIDTYKRTGLKPTYGATAELHEQIGTHGALECIATICERYKGENLSGVVDRAIAELTRFRGEVVQQGAGK